MKKYPKYIVMPTAMAIYFVAMAVYGIYRNNGKLPDDFALICAIEVFILVTLFFSLRYLDRKRRQ